MLAIFGLLLAALSAVFFASSLTTYIRWMGFVKKGAACTGTVASIEARPLKSGKSTRTVFQPVVCYTVDGTEYTQELKTGDLSAQYAPGDTVELRYKLADPRAVILEDKTGTIAGIRKMLLTTFAMLVAGVLVFLLCR